MRTRNALLLALCTAFLLTSCIPESENPLSDPKNAQCDSRLLGTWVAEVEDGEGNAWLHFVEGPDAMTEIVVVSHEKGKGADVSFYHMHPTPVGASWYMNIKPYAPEKFRTADIAEEMGSSGYLFANYEITAEGLLLIRLVGKDLGEAVRAGKLRGEIKESKYFEDIKITDSSENLVKFLESADPATLLEPFLKCRKAPLPSSP
jgi:hypothetical protein